LLVKLGRGRRIKDGNFILLSLQVEYAFPPLEVELDKSAWKYLPTLAMPDGAHNYEHDTVYFHLPSLKNPRETVFGVACYQQIDSAVINSTRFRLISIRVR